MGSKQSGAARAAEGPGDLGIDVEKVLGQKPSRAREGRLEEQAVAEQLELLRRVREAVAAKVLVVCNKADDEDVELDFAGEVFRLGFRDHVMLSAQFGNNMHALWEDLDRAVPPDLKEAFEKTLKRRKARVRQFRRNFGALVEDYLGEFGDSAREGPAEDWRRGDPNAEKLRRKGRLLDKEHFLEEFDRLNRGAEFESDLDDEEVPLENLLRTPRLIEEKGVSFENPLLNNVIEVAVVGRPNTGKSTLVNKWLGRRVSLVDEASHTTRDSCGGDTRVQGRRMRLVDTAGVSKSLRESWDEVDQMAFFKTRQQVRLAQVHVVVGSANASGRNVGLPRAGLRPPAEEPRRGPGRGGVHQQVGPGGRLLVREGQALHL